MDEVATGRTVERSGLEAALSREDLEAVLGRISEGITLQTPDGRIVYANEAAADLLRLETPEDVVGAPMGDPPHAYYAEWEFADEDAFKSGTRSDEFTATGKDAYKRGYPMPQVEFAVLS